jgi:hypothetical protein
MDAARTETSPIVLLFTKLDLFKLHLFRTLRSALPPCSALRLKLRIMSCQPYVPDEVVHLGQGKDAFWRKRMVEERVDIR